MDKITDEQVKQLAKDNGIDYAALKAFMEVESGGRGFDENTGKLIIQFEPAWFRKKAPYAPSGLWRLNKVDVQTKEWAAFNDAFSKDPQAALLTTSIGLPQIMAFNYVQCGYRSVNDMWDDFKKGEYNQVAALVRFIRANKKLYAALAAKDWHTVASIYNGSGYKDLARRLKREPYDKSLEKAYVKYDA
ncbi:MAG: N-acetylmuramidase domain-containing protein [Edaphocola sp.]